MGHFKEIPHFLSAKGDDRFHHINRYLDYLQLSREAGNESWLAISLGDRTTILKEFAKQYQIYAEILQPWTSTLCRILKEIISLLEYYQQDHGSYVMRHPDNISINIEQDLQRTQDWTGGLDDQFICSPSTNTNITDDFDDIAIDDYSDFPDTPLRAQRLYQLPVGIALENPLTYTLEHDEGVKSTNPKKNMWTQITSASPALIEVFKAINTLKFTDDERTQILKWGAISKSPYQLLRNREYMRALYFSTKFQQELRESVEVLLNRWGVRSGHTATCVMIPGEWLRHSPDDLLIIGQTDIKGLLHKLVPPGRKKEQIRRSRYQRAYIDRYTKWASAGSSTDESLEAHMHTPVARVLAWMNDRTMTREEKDRCIIHKHTQVSHLCGVAWCLVSEHLRFETMALNDAQDLCKVNAAELRRLGKPVPKFCGAHKKGEDNCLMQLMALTICERLNIMMSTLKGEARNWFDDPQHPYKRSRENCLPLRFPRGFGPHTINTELDDNASILRYEGPANIPPQQCLCHLCAKSYIRFDVRIFRHYVTDHLEHPQFLETVVSLARKWLALENTAKHNKVVLCAGICQKLLDSDVDKAKAVAAIKLK